MEQQKRSPWGATFGILAVVGCGITGAYLGEARQHGVRVPIQTDFTGKALYASKSNKIEIPEGDYFTSVIDQLDEKFVEPKQDHQKVAIGAVRGMVAYLADPLANFMNPKQFASYLKAQQGEFEGIGVEVLYQYPKQTPKRSELQNRAEDAAPLDVADYIPDLVVTAVMPGSPAEKAGMRPGDRIDSVDDRPVLSAREFVEFRNETKKVRESKLTPADMDKALRALQDRANKALAPAKVRDLLTLGTSGSIKVAWERGDQVMTQTLAKQVTKVDPVRVGPDGTVEVRLFQGADAALAKVLSEGKPVKLDLRNSGQGSYDVLTKTLSLLAPSGKYGVIANESGERQIPLESSGPGFTGGLTLIVDKTTRGVAEVLAEALRASGRAKLEGDPKMAGDRAFITSAVLPDGSGYTLPTGRYEAQPKPKQLAQKEVGA